MKFEIQLSKEYRLAGSMAGFFLLGKFVADAENEEAARNAVQVAVSVNALDTLVKDDTGRKWSETYIPSGYEQRGAVTIVKVVRSNIAEYSWEELGAFRFTVGMETVVIISNATREQMLLLWEQWSGLEYHQGNFVDYVKEEGYQAVDAGWECELN